MNSVFIKGAVTKAIVSLPTILFKLWFCLSVFSFSFYFSPLKCSHKQWSLKDLGSFEPEFQSINKGFAKSFDSLDYLLNPCKQADSILIFEDIDSRALFGQQPSNLKLKPLLLLKGHIFDFLFHFPVTVG